MSRASTSLDLTEFFSNDDSDGHRLAEFLQKRRGGVQRQNFLFMNCEPQRMSLNVQLEKLTPSQQKNIDKQIEEGEKVIEKETNECAENINIGDANDKSVEEQIASLHGETYEKSWTCPNVGDKGNIPSNKSTLPDLPAVPQRSLEPMSPRSVDSARSLSPRRPQSPRLSAIRKSGGVSPSDKLRRYSLKRLSKLCGGRRTLLQEFESTVSDCNFDPPVCSTPLSQPQKDKLPTTIQSSAAENIESNFTDKSPSANDSCGHTDTLIRSLQRKEEELKNYVENILESTLKRIQSNENEKTSNANKQNEAQQPISTASKSPLKRTYTIEKGLTPGQVILTPDRSITGQSPQHSKLLKSRKQPSSHEMDETKIFNNAERNKNTSIILADVKKDKNSSSHRNFNKSTPQTNSTSGQININTSRSNSPILEKERGASGLSNSLNYNHAVCEVPNTPPQNNTSRVFSKQNVMDVVIPETQDLPAEAEDNIIKSNTQKHSEVSEVEHKRKHMPEDDLKLTDILTDDEDVTPKVATSSIVENSQAPLNLAPSTTNVRNKRMRKRSASRRRLRMDYSQLQSTETENEPVFANNNNSNPANRRRIFKKRQIPLNKAPGTPLNGERFAQELARMSNYEILDLRKRNSMGRVFPISGRRSTRSHEDAVKKQHELDDRIEMELIRRNLDEAATKQSSEDKVMVTSAENDKVVVEKDVHLETYPPVPSEFRDSLVNQYKLRESPLIDEKSSDRISFKSKINNSDHNRLSKGKKKPMPEVLKQYLQITEIITLKKKRNNSLDKSKRSLYTQGQSDSEETNRSIHLNLRNKKESIPSVPSPPKSDYEKITNVKVVSPPPPLSITPRKSLNTKNQTQIDTEENLILPPPPPGFESDSGVSSNNLNSHCTTICTTQTAEVTTITTNATNMNANNNNNNSESNNNDEQIFKKPQQPPPKKRGRKLKVDKANELKASTGGSEQTNTTECVLRRSKRGQVPLKYPTQMFQILFQQSINRRLEKMEKDREKQKKKLRANSQTINSDTINSTSDKSTKSEKARRKSPRLPTVPENSTLIDLFHQDVEIFNDKIPTKHTESQIKRKRNKKSNSQMQSDDVFECSRLTMATPPPVDHLNNVFDQLRNTSTTNSSSTSHSVSGSGVVAKIKPLRIHVARIKHTKPSGCTPVLSPTKNSTQVVKDNNLNFTKNITTSNSVSSCTVGSSNNSNYELISWLKNITESEGSAERNEEIFKEMRISAASNLSFTELQGVEYAFYDTDEKASLGYLRFKPRQIKPKKKAKRFHLHFVTLVGNFRITANDKVSQVGVGDMVAIEKSVYYDIENITDDIGILMVIKK